VFTLICNNPLVIGDEKVIHSHEIYEGCEKQQIGLGPTFKVVVHFVIFVHFVVDTEMASSCAYPPPARLRRLSIEESLALAEKTR
jgi:hypothetical protein